MSDGAERRRGADSDDDKRGNDDEEEGGGRTDIVFDSNEEEETELEPTVPSTSVVLEVDADKAENLVMREVAA